MKIIDLSVPINSLPVEPPIQMPKIEYIDHKHELAYSTILELFPGISVSDLPDECAWAVEFVHLMTHSGTHMDAPYHYHPTMNNGERAWTIDEVPLEWCMGDGIVLDLTDKEDGYVCKPDDLKKALDKIKYTLKQNDIVLIKTTAPEAWGSPAYMLKGCGIGKEGTLWLLDQGVHLVGTNAWSWDAPLSLVAKKFVETKDASLIWEGHKAGMIKAYCHMEKLWNLDKLPPYGFTFIGFPIKIEKASGGWIRAVGVVKE